MKRLNALILSLLLLETSAFAEKVSWTVDSKASPVTFQAIGKPGFLKINGENANVEGTIGSNDGKLSGVLNVPLAGLKTGIDLRDDHMKNNYFEVSKYPNAVLTLDETPSTLDGKDQPFTGKLKLKNVEKPIKGSLCLKDQSGKEATGHAEFEVQMSDFKDLGVPNYKGITVAETVKVFVDLKAKR